MERGDNIHTDVTVIGAGLTGLTLAFWLKRKGVSVKLVEKNSRTGGQILTCCQNGFLFETGPTTGSVATPEVAELMSELNQTSQGKCELETAPQAAKRRLIWKGKRFHDLPAGPLGGIRTSLFRWKDKIRILREPWRKKGTDPDESVAQLTKRRLGRSFLQYAVDPFLSGVYAGDPDKLVTRYALPKLYQLEQQYGSFIKGAIAKKKQPKTDRDKLATKKVFSAVGGLSRIIEAETAAIGLDNVFLNAEKVNVEKGNLHWITSFSNEVGKKVQIESQFVVTTCGAYQLADILSFIPSQLMKPITDLRYAPVVEVNVGVKDTLGGDYCAFGGLVPSVEKRKVLGVLYPSACFSGRAPEGGALFSFFVGGVKHPELFEMSDREIEELVVDEFHKMLKFPENVKPDFIHVSRHLKAIPQYERTSGERFKAVEKIQKDNEGLIIAGNLRDGIGMAHRITQATNIANDILKKLKG